MVDVPEAEADGDGALVAVSVERTVKKNGKPVRHMWSPDPAAPIPVDWWTSEVKMRSAEHCRDKKGDLITIEVIVTERGVCFDDETWAAMNKKNVERTLEALAELGLNYWNGYDK